MLEYIKKKYKDYLYIEVMPEDKNNVPFYVKNGFSVMENGAAIQICNLCEEKQKNAEYMRVSHYILRFVYSFLYILLLITLRIPITLYVKKMLIGSWIRFLVNLIVR